MTDNTENETTEFDLSALLGGMDNMMGIPPLDPAEARNILCQGFDLLNKDHTFNPGDIIRRKPVLYTGTNDLRGGVAVFVEYTVPEPGFFEPLTTGTIVSLIDLDCIIALVTPTGEVAEHFTCSRYYEPAPAVEAIA